MTFSQAVSNGFSKFFTPTGRATRSEFWWWYLFLVLCSIIIGFVIGMLFGTQSAFTNGICDIMGLIFGISFICAAIRRLHDIGKSGWNYCWIFLPLIGAIYLIVLWCRSSQPTPNRFGPTPEYYFNTYSSGPYNNGSNPPYPPYNP